LPAARKAAEPHGRLYWRIAIFISYGVQAIPNCVVIDQEARIALIGKFKEAAVEAAKLPQSEAK
jgi:hypothetical protein